MKRIALLLIAAATAASAQTNEVVAAIAPTNAAQRVVAPDPVAPTNGWWRTFPETEEAYLALCEPKIQEALLDYPEEERENMRELLRSEASTAYLVQGIYAALLRNGEDDWNEKTNSPAHSPETPSSPSSTK